MTIFNRLSRALGAALQAWDATTPTNTEQVNDIPPAGRPHRLPAGFRRRVRTRLKLPTCFSPPEDYATFHVYRADWSVIPIPYAHSPSQSLLNYLQKISSAQVDYLNYTAICFTQAELSAKVIWYLAKRDNEKYRNLPHPDMAHGLSFNMYLIGNENIPFVGAREWGFHEWWFASRMRVTHPWFRYAETIHLTPELAKAMDAKQAAAVLTRIGKNVQPIDM